MFHYHRCLTAFALAGFAVVSLGCNRWIDGVPSSLDPMESVTKSIVKEERVPFVMDGFRLVQNGASQDPPSEIERRFLNAVQETHLFSTLIPIDGNRISLGDKAVTARLTMEGTIDPRSGSTAWKGFSSEPQCSYFHR